MIEFIEDTLDIIFCNYVFFFVWHSPLFIHKIILSLTGLTCYQYSSPISPYTAYRWEFRKDVPLSLDIVKTRFGYSNNVEESIGDRFTRIIKAIKEYREYYYEQ